jgi:putative ubiquitin-RnfH superfamily antitoxin RatB of RatAB toxin-antitoxin module
MELKEKISRVQFLRSQIREIEINLNRLRDEMASLDRDIKLELDKIGEEYEHLTEDEFQAMLSSLNDKSQIRIEVVYALRDRQQLSVIQVNRGATIEDSIMISGILDEFEEINLETCKVGIYGNLRKLSDAVVEGDRIEIYRPVE